MYLFFVHFPFSFHSFPLLTKFFFHTWFLFFKCSLIYASFWLEDMYLNVEPNGFIKWHSMCVSFTVRVCGNHHIGCNIFIFFKFSNKFLFFSLFGLKFLSIMVLSVYIIVCHFIFFFRTIRSKSFNLFHFWLTHLTKKNCFFSFKRFSFYMFI